MGSIIKKINNFLKNPRRIFYIAIIELNRYNPKLISDKLCIKANFYLRLGYELNLKHPTTFSEKLQWLKLYDRRPEYTKMVDKYEAKKYAASVIGEEYIIPTLGVWDRAEDIEWDRLPDQFVLKCTHDSGDLIICKDKSKLDKENAIKKLNEGLKRDYYMVWREWPYKNVPRRVIAETYIEPQPDTKDLPDYKFFCFDGVVKAMFVATERQNPNEEVKFDFFDENYNHLPFRQGHDHAKVLPSKPRNFELMKQLASQLSNNIPQVRVDFYDLGDKVLFGEMTFFHFSGMVPFEPYDWDKYWGTLISIPSQK